MKPVHALIATTVLLVACSASDPSENHLESAGGTSGAPSGTGGTERGGSGGSTEQGGSSGQGGLSGGGQGGSAGSTGGAAGSAGSAAGGSAGSGGGTGSGIDYAPYFYTWGWGNTAYPFSNLVDMKAKSGLDAVTLAFVLSDGGCHATRDVHNHLADIQAFQAGGGRVKVSFGGALGTYLENGCGSAPAMAEALRAFVDETTLRDFDFDVEQHGAMTGDVNQRRAEALRAVQLDRGIRVSFTLAAIPRDKWDTPGGVTAAGLAVLSAAVAAGVEIQHVNLMTMDYGGYFSDGNAMGDLAVSVLTETHGQLLALMPGLTEAAAWKMLGATPMIGQNDVATEVFTLSDAQILVEFAKQKDLGLLSFWAINRDQPCPYNDLGVCSKVNTADFQFHAIFSGVN